MDLQLRGKTAIITGAGSGIGQAIALAYAREGANVVLADISREGIEETLGQIHAERSDANVELVVADAGEPQDHARTVQAALGAFGQLDIACNNAGIGGRQANVEDLTPDDWRRTIEVNLNGVFYAMNAQIPAMLQGEDGGAIVNMASILGQVAMPTSSAYVASKHGVIGLTRAAALENATRGVRVNAVGPGFIETPILGEDRQKLDHLAELHPIKRLGRPEEIANLVVFLSSPRASLITGAYYNVDGGFLAQ